mgnify:CR=1 FL=1
MVHLRNRYLLSPLKISVEGDFKGPVVHFEDGAETRLLADNKNQTSILGKGILFRHLLAQFNSFLKQYNNSKIVYISNDGEPAPISSRGLILPRTVFL